MDGVNKTSLAAIETAAFVVVLDEEVHEYDIVSPPNSHQHHFSYVFCVFHWITLLYVSFIYDTGD